MKTDILEEFSPCLLTLPLFSFLVVICLSCLQNFYPLTVLQTGKNSFQKIFLMAFSIITIIPVKGMRTELTFNCKFQLKSEIAA